MKQLALPPQGTESYLVSQEGPGGHRTPGASLGAHSGGYRDSANLQYAHRSNCQLPGLLSGSFEIVSRNGPMNCCHDDYGL